MAKIKDLRSMTVDELEAKLVEAKKRTVQSSDSAVYRPVSEYCKCPQSTPRNCKNQHAFNRA